MMDTPQISLIHRVLASSDETEFLQRVEEAAHAIGFSHVLVGVEWRRRVQPPVQHAVSGWPEPYKRLYVERRLVGIDPTVPHCQRSNTPLVWTDDMYASSRSWEVREESARYGLRHGMSFPVHDGRTLVSMTSLARHEPFRSEEESARCLAGGEALAVIAHEVAKRLLVPLLARRVVDMLTPRELEILKWIAHGKSNTMIADILNTSDNNVEKHVGNLFRKLSVANRVAAAIAAVELGLV